MRSIEELLREQPFFRNLDEDALRLIAGCAVNRHAHVGEYLFRDGETADTFYLIRHGRVALEMHVPAGGSVVIETLDEGEVVGWSWLIPPHRWQFDARVVEETSMVAFDGACLRGKCDADPRLGYTLLRSVTQVMLDRLQSTRVRLLDLYGAPGAHRS